MSSKARWQVHGVLLLLAAAMCFFSARSFALERPAFAEYFFVGGLAAFLLFAFVSSVTLAMTRSSLSWLLHLAPMLLAGTFLVRNVRAHPTQPAVPVAARPVSPPTREPEPPQPESPAPPPRAQPAPGWTADDAFASVQVRRDGQRLLVTVVAHFTGTGTVEAMLPEDAETLDSESAGRGLCAAFAETPVECVVPLKVPVTFRDVKLVLTFPGQDPVLLGIDDAGAARQMRL